MQTADQFTELTMELLTLLDQIEVEEDLTLTVQRFKILEKYGEVQFGFEISSREH